MWPLLGLPQRSKLFLTSPCEEDEKTRLDWQLIGRLMFYFFRLGFVVVGTSFPLGLWSPFLCILSVGLAAHRRYCSFFKATWFNCSYITRQNFKRKSLTRILT